MSGGSFNYLYMASDMEDLTHRDNDLAAMRDELIGLDAEDIAAEIEELRLTLRQVNLRCEVVMRRNRDVLRAVEWWRSADKTRDDVVTTIARHRGADHVDG